MEREEGNRNSGDLGLGGGVSSDEQEEEEEEKQNLLGLTGLSGFTACCLKGFGDKGTVLLIEATEGSLLITGMGSLIST